MEAVQTAPVPQKPKTVMVQVPVSEEERKSLKRQALDEDVTLTKLLRQRMGLD